MVNEIVVRIFSQNKMKFKIKTEKSHRQGSQSIPKNFRDNRQSTNTKTE